VKKDRLSSLASGASTNRGFVGIVGVCACIGAIVGDVDGPAGGRGVAGLTAVGFVGAFPDEYFCNSSSFVFSALARLGLFPLPAAEGEGGTGAPMAPISSDVSNLRENGLVVAVFVWAKLV
jgi:hypothetical protein